MRNNVQVVDAVRKGKNSFSKKDIQRETGMAWGTMCKVVNSLLADGFIFARKEEPVGRGRPMIPLCVNPETAFFIGLDIGASQSKAVICDLAFNVVYRGVTSTPKYKEEESFFSWLFGFYDDVLNESRIPHNKLSGIGLAVSGNVDTKNGVIVSGGNFGVKWGTNLPAAERLGAHSGVAVFAVSTNSAAAWGEYNFGIGNGCGNLVTIGLGVGIGSGVVSNHHLLISQPGRPVGYIGHMLIPGNNHICTCGFRGCLESYSGGDYLAAVAKEQLPDNPELHSAHALDQAAANGYPVAIHIISTAASYNAVGIASMIQLYSPKVLIFSGGQCHKDGFLFNRTIDAINEILPVERRQRVDFHVSNLGKYQSALGAARLAYEKFF
jgi:predicted NBD/HSP70 family sugar kinase